MNQQEQEEQEQEEQQEQEPIKQPTHQQLRLKHYIILSSLSLSFLLLAIIHITIGERLNNNISPSRIQDSLRLNIPSTRLKIGELTAQNSLSLSIQTNLTLDLHQLTSSKNRLGKTVEEKLLRWLVAQSPNATLSSSSPIQIYEADNHGDQQEPLLELTLLEPFILPLSYTLPSKHLADDHPSPPPPPTQRTTIALRIHFRAPARLPPLLLSPALDLRVVIKDLDLRLNAHNGLPAWLARFFRKLTHVSLPHLALQLSLPLPKLPAGWTDPSKLLQIDSYSFYPLSAGSTTEDELEPKVGIRASVSAPNPLQLLKQYIDELDLEMHISWPIPLSIFLLPPPSNHSSSSSSTDPQSVPLASSLTLPFLLDANTEQVSITIEGFLLPSLASSPNNTSAPQEQDESALSGFLNRFLKGKTNDLLIRYRGDLTAAGEVSRGLLSTEGGGRAVQHRFSIDDDDDDEGPKQTRVPSLVVAFLAALNVRLEFPGNAHAELVESIGVREMKIDLPAILPPHPQLLCSGELRAVVVLPPHLVGLSSILSILDVRPDVLLLDGPLPSSSIPPQPDDDQVVLPETAFARLFPEHYLPASLRLILPNSTTSSASTQVKLLLTSSFVKLPLQVLDGRNPVFRRYAAKYLLHHRRHQAPDGDDDDDQEGVLTSIVGAFDAHSSIAHTFLVQLLGVDVRGSFYV
ncbi:hypothetical protein PGTUg99_007880 [Puccinia graminis f. sp. tritici]|uniref:Uncharacterized protein n=1 Tax=Puccinia graminis f. sp. tritici TaxID=56615 RepID=A0A5B0M1Q8_PUCGR|nr:hypothetical protein PGTUg99_007880 [Puccinia graminis f. sp. tritici]